jgi:hypothetical protein
MQYVGSEYIVLFNDPQLLRGLIRDADRPRRSDLAGEGTYPFRRWFALALHGLASWVDPASRTMELRSAQRVWSSDSP